MNLNFKNTEFWNSLHGQVPGMADWDFENELGLSRTTDQNFSGARHLQRRSPATPQQPQARKSDSDQDDPHIEPNLRMWVNPNIVCPLEVQGTPNPNPDPNTNPEPNPDTNAAVNPDPGPNPEPDPDPKPNPEPDPEPDPEPKPDPKPDPKPKSKPKSKSKAKTNPKSNPKPNPADTRKTRSKRPLPQPPSRNKGSSCSEATGAELPRSQHSKKKKSSTSSVKNVELTEKAGGAQKSSSAALQSPNKECAHQQKSGQVDNQQKKSWSRPPLNYGHLTALALKNSPPSGLNVQGIYSFVRQHFPFFQTAPGGWKNTIRHNLCFLGSFKKVPVNVQDGSNSRPRACLWMLTEEGHRRFHEETRPLAFARKQVIQKSMSNPEMISSLFNF